VNAALREKFGITHATLQLESADYHDGDARECAPTGPAPHGHYHDHHDH